jgi:succinate dehydrogenase / fumarate reductase flavoprotein subunit
MNSEGGVVPGLMAIGEAACNSVHGANRLGCNSLLDLMVFGKDAGDWAIANLTPGNVAEVRRETIAAALAPLTQLDQHGSTISSGELRQNIQYAMRDHAAIFRDGAGLAKALAQLQCYAAQMPLLPNLLTPWNNQLLHLLETRNLLLQAIATVRAALERRESRGAHFREDFPNRNDAEWLCHSLVYVDTDGATRYNQRAVRQTTAPDAPYFAPEIRNY